MRLNKALNLIFIIIVLVIFCGCGIYDKEYLAVNDYVISSADLEKNDDKTVINTFSDLMDAVESLVMNGEKSGRYAFSESYQGDENADMSKACWDIRSKNALCAYCVKDISYEINKIVNYYEVEISVSYADTGVPFEDIYQMQYSSGLSELIKKAIENGDKKLVVLINNSSITDENIISTVSSIYNKNPICAPKEPTVNVQVYSGNGKQKLYNITFNYGMSDDKLTIEKEELSFINPFDEDYESDSEKFSDVCNYLKENCVLGEGDTIYDALVNKEGNSKALALATIALCKNIGLNCQMVEGQMSYSAHYWNIVSIDGTNFHFDPSAFLSEESDTPHLKTDSEMWNDYRWDTSSYPQCATALQ